MLTRVTLSNNTQKNTKFKLKQFEVMSDILKQLEFVFLPKLENYSEFTKQIVMEVEDSVVNLPNTEIKEAAK
jgi:hypothetical protein